MIIRGHVSLISFSVSLSLSQNKKRREVSRGELNLFVKVQCKYSYPKAPAIVKGFGH